MIDWLKIIDSCLKNKTIKAKFQSFHCSKEQSLYEEVGESIIALLKDNSDLFNSALDGRISSSSTCKLSIDSTTVMKIEILLDVIWENVNIGHWKDVDVFWRQVFLIISFFKAVVFVFRGDLHSALTASDKGIIMGAPFEKETYLQELADSIQNVIARSRDLTMDCKIPVFKAVKPLPDLPNSKIVPIYESPSLEHYLQLIEVGRPFVMKNIINHWPALNKWSVEYLVQKFGERLVPIEIGSSYTSSSWTQKLISIEEFVDRYITCSHSAEPGYLAQYELLNHITRLKEDIYPIDYCIASSSEDIITNCWIGPTGTVSPAHHDPYHNLFCQIQGYKRFIMFHRHENLYPHHHHLLRNTSQIDVESPSIEQFPDYEKCSAWVTDLGPGDVLYIPLGWWHHVRSLSISFSVSFWWNK